MERIRTKRRIKKRRLSRIGPCIDKGNNREDPKPQPNITIEPTIMSEKPQKEKKVEKVEKEAEIVSIHDFKSMLIGMDLILGDEWTPDDQGELRQGRAVASVPASDRRYLEQSANTTETA